MIDEVSVNLLPERFIYHLLEAILMIWEVCIRYANGIERILRSYQNRETALKYVDALYKVHGYPLHFAYIVRPKHAVQPASAL